MQEKVITWATPVFFALIALELAWGWRRGRTGYRLNDAITSLSLGAISQTAGVFTRVLRIGIYAAVFEHVALARWPAGAWWALPAALLAYDFCYYWHHRWMHEIGIAWAAHVVHHSSEDYNLSTALRQTGTGALLGWIPYVPLAIAGVPPALFGAVALIDLLYQFWIHTEAIGRLGWFDRVFASPSNHRVHHAVNDRYVDRNYGGLLIVWDRIFGTFQDEREDDPPVYGTRSPLRSFNPLWANFEVYARLARDSLRTKRWADKLQVWVRRPGWRAPDLARTDPEVPFSLPARRRYDPRIPAAAGAYAGVQFAIALACSVHLLQVQARAPAWETAAYLAWTVLALVAVGGLLEGRRTVLPLEIARLVLAAVVVTSTGRWFGTGPISVVAQAATCLAALACAIAAWRIVHRLPRGGGEAVDRHARPV
jgi:sterol desaturase/sphingolipid hydroxylase (fatty acid hydroxylase superfamily)